MVVMFNRPGVVSSAFTILFSVDEMKIFDMVNV